MKYLILCINLLITTSVYGQDKFAITPNGLSPQFSTSRIDHLTRNQIYEKTLTWIELNEEAYKLSVQDKTENEVIQLTSVKWNAVNLGEKYYTSEYNIHLIFEENKYKFEPTAIRLKLNSKYDMGWENFDLSNGDMYFKKDKIFKKYKVYLKDLMLGLNEVSLRLNSHLNAN